MSVALPSLSLDDSLEFPEAGVFLAVTDGYANVANPVGLPNPMVDDPVGLPNPAPEGPVGLPKLEELEDLWCANPKPGTGVSGSSSDSSKLQSLYWNLLTQSVFLIFPQITNCIKISFC